MTASSSRACRSRRSRRSSGARRRRRASSRAARASALQAEAPSPPQRDRHRTTVEAFLAALRAGDFDGLVAVLDPDVVVRGGHGAAELAGAAQAAKKYAHGAFRALRVTFSPDGGTITAIDVVSDPAALAALDLALL